MRARVEKVDVLGWNKSIVTEDYVQHFYTLSSNEDVIADIFLTSGLDVIRYLICSSTEINIK